MKYLTVRHTTRYRYSNPVTFGSHRLMLRPRDSHDLRLVDAELTLSPPGEVRWLHDVFGNSVAQVDFAQSAPELLIESTLHLERYGGERPKFAIAPDAQVYPFVYSASDRTDLGRLLERHYPDPHGVVDDWARTFVVESPMPTYDLLKSLNSAFKRDFTYNLRYEEGTQSPIETLERKSGSCRDYALLFMEAVRSLGFGARFITGYLYDPALDGGHDAMTGSAATHAWADVYLPGAGWTEFDPTNGLIARESLIRVAVTRDPSQAVPVSGTFDGTQGQFLGMTVDVSVTSQPPAQQGGATQSADAASQPAQPVNTPAAAPGVPQAVSMPQQALTPAETLAPQQAKPPVAEPA